ncbi:MAG TPA: aldo/keto reductase [Mycobacteriales bacterium]|nr:aldo/keto reductase [Mycobacteriales bacterium]
MRAIPLPSGEPVPVLGMGTWHMAEDPVLREAEIAALRTGLDLGLSVVDTAEMYADGAAEQLVGVAVEGRRDEAFLVGKVLPSHATRHGTVDACHASLRRLRTDRIDLYLLHWRGGVPLAETIAGFADLVEAGDIRYWGVSNFDVDDLEELVATPGGTAVAVDQVLYNLMRRGPEFDLLPWCEERGLPVMAYSPVEQGRLLGDPAVRGVAERHDVTAAQVALAWVLRRPLLNAIPKAGTPKHVHEDAVAVTLRLTPADLAELDEAFPPPTRKRPLETL